MANYFSYPEGIEKNVEWKINKKNTICYVSECSKNGGVLPEGIQIFRDCKSIKEDNKRMLWDAKEQVQGILNLKETVIDFINHWKKVTFPTKEDKNFIFDEKGKMKGICFELPGVQNHDMKFVIELPHLYALINKTDDDNINCICFYGDRPKLENCEHIAMHLCSNGTSEAKAEFVFLTPIPDEWYKKTDNYYTK